ncbi:MAG TPA: hypothetical protein VND42_05975 [Candidatus Acidoferrales bacterium]|nr:hypothetical protein [Candidatus Acidoferrales bacterium]
MGDLENTLPEDLKKRGARSGSELILTYGDALRAIAVANEQIAVWGLEGVDILPEGPDHFYVCDYTRYDNDIKFAGDWQAFMTANNSEAERWIEQHPLGDGHGYILTSASETEFAVLRNLRL